MLVGDDISRAIDDKSGAEALQRLPNFSRSSLIIGEELRIEVIERIPHGPPDDTFGVDIDHRRQNLRNRNHGGLGGRICLAERELRQAKKRCYGYEERSTTGSPDETFAR